MIRCHNIAQGYSSVHYHSNEVMVEGRVHTWTGCICCVVGWRAGHCFYGYAVAELHQMHLTFALG